jgi:hypothetical protein
MLGLGLVVPKVAGYSALLILLISLPTRKDNLSPLETWWIGASLFVFWINIIRYFYGVRRC